MLEDTTELNEDDKYLKNLIGKTGAEFDEMSDDDIAGLDLGDSDFDIPGLDYADQEPEKGAEDYSDELKEEPTLMDLLGDMSDEPDAELSDEEKKKRTPFGSASRDWDPSIGGGGGGKKKKQKNKPTTTSDENCKETDSSKRGDEEDCAVNKVTSDSTMKNIIGALTDRRF